MSLQKTLITDSDAALAKLTKLMKYFLTIQNNSDSLFVRYVESFTANKVTDYKWTSYNITKAEFKPISLYKTDSIYKIINNKIRIVNLDKFIDKDNNVIKPRSILFYNRMVRK